MDNFETHLRTLVRLALSDQKFSEVEKSMIYVLGKAHRIKEEDIRGIIDEELKSNGKESISFVALSFEEKFEYLYNIIQLMKIDNEVYLSEIRFCEQLAEKIGFNQSVVKKISTRIYSDPSITSNRELLKDQARKFLKN